MTAPTTHVLMDAHPQPSGWRAYCTCGWHTRGHDRFTVSGLFLEHCEQQHLTVTDDKDVDR